MEASDRGNDFNRLQYGVGGLCLILGIFSSAAGLISAFPGEPCLTLRVTSLDKGTQDAVKKCGMENVQIFHTSWTPPYLKKGGLY